MSDCATESSQGDEEASGNHGYGNGNGNGYGKGRGAGGHGMHGSHMASEDE